MKNAKKKFISAIAVFTLSSATLFGALSFAGCANKISPTTEETIQRQLYTVSSAMGERTVEASGKVYYVSPTGTGTEGTQENPADLSIINAVAEESVLKPGDTVILKDGVYEQDSTIRLYVSGEYDKPITVKAEHPGKATISMYKQGWGGRGVQINGSFINFMGINVCGSGDNGIYVGGSYNLIENCELYDNRDTGLQIGRGSGSDNTVDKWPSYNLIKNCSSHNNYDNQTYGENADGYAAKLTLGYGNVFDGCIAYRNSDDGWDLFAKSDTGNLGQVIIYNCVAFENGYLENTQEVSNARFGSSFDTQYAEANQNVYTTRDGDGNGFKLGGESMYGDVFVYNCLSFGNRMHGFTDNSNPGYLSLKNCTAVDNGAAIDNNSESATFGHIIDKASGTHANYDVSRQSYSYNHIDHSLSAQTAMGAHAGLVSDKYRGSVSDSLFIGYTVDNTGKYSDVKTAYKVTGSIDADVKNYIAGTAQSALLDSSAIFEKYHVDIATTGEGAEAVKTYTHNVTGKNDRNAGTEGDGRAHVRFRNADGSINMGDIYKVKDYSPLLGDENKIGAVLDLETYADYTHYALSDFTDSETFETATDVRLQAACDMLYLQTDADAVYQDFKAVTKIYGCEVSWTSSDEDILKVTKTYWGSDLSKAEYAPIQVTRPTDADTEVTLTATVHYFGKTKTREFVVNVKKDAAKIGEISVIGPTGDKIESGNSIIVDRFTVLKDPVMTVLNGADYNGKQLTEAQANFTIKYEYADDIAALNNGSAVVVKGFTTSATGAFKVTMKVALKDKSDSVEFVYYVLVASNTANISFLNDNYNIVVNAEGYNLSGDLTSAIGTLYSYSCTEQLAEENLTAAYIKEHGISHTFRATRISFDFPNANAGAYYTYSVFANGNGEITSKIYTNHIEQVEISTKEDFKKLAQGETETESTKIYVLTLDLDYEGETWTLADDAEGKGLSGLFNGGGHKISNLTVDGKTKNVKNVGVFRGLLGGTITNVTFENITSAGGTADRVGGIVGVVERGTISYVQVKNIKVTSGGQRVGALIGQIVQFNESADYVDYSANVHHVSIVNDMTKNEDGSYKYGVFANTRVGGIVGLIQSGTSTLYVDVTISDCYIKSFIGGTGGDYQGGIVGLLDARSVVTGKDRLEITNCYTDCVMLGNRRTAGIYGGTSGANGKLVIAGCASTGTVLNNALDKPITAPNSNNLSSVIGVGGHAQVSNIAALFADRNYNGALTLLTADSIKLAETWTALGFDLENTWTLDATNGGITLQYTVAE